jgi:hypothetical protein
MPGGKPRLGRTIMSIRLTPEARAVLGESPSARATEVLEQWARAQVRSVDRAEIESLLRECERTHDGDGVELLGQALNSDEGSAAWVRGAELALAQRDRPLDEAG